MAGTVSGTRRQRLTNEQRRARHDELVAKLADAVAALATSEGWLRYLRALSTLREYSTGNCPIFQTHEYTACYLLSADEHPAWHSSMAAERPSKLEQALTKRTRDGDPRDTQPAGS